MKTLSVPLLSLLLALSFAPQTLAQQPDYQGLKAEAERHFAASSYALARDAYERAAKLELHPAERRWVEFRIADASWRAQAATATADTTTYERAQKKLEELVRDRTREEERDRVWAEAQESLADFFWTRRDSREWHRAWTHYQQALDWWAGARDLETARTRYLKIVWTIARPPHADDYYYFGYYGNVLPLEVLENAVKLARTEDERAHANYLLAMTLRGHHDTGERRRAAEAFEAALKPGKLSDWYDDALYFYAEWLSSQGRPRLNEEGQWLSEPDYKRALELFRRILAEHKKGETRFYEQAKQQVEEITKRTVSVGVSNVFLPGSQVSFELSWRNVRRVEFALYRVDLTTDVRLSDDASDASSWLRHVSAAGRVPLKTWAKETDDAGEHRPGEERVQVKERLPVGAYLLEATAAGSEVARELVLVTDAALILKTSGTRALLYFCDAVTGAPVVGARVRVWEQFQHEGKDRSEWRASERVTNADGLAVFPLDRTRGRYHSGIFASAAQGERQAFGLGHRYTHQADARQWRVYAFTDRPAYRPGESVRWKLIARLRDASGAYSTPAQQTLRFRVTDPRGALVKEGAATLNAFGSAWGEVELTNAMPLGEYNVAFSADDWRTQVGSARLFRLEEYKLPEFKVSVSTPEENGRRKAFRVGEKVEVKIQADYYFGGPVAGGSVEVVVRQNPFYHYYHPPREFGWYYDEMQERRHYYGGQGPIVKQETLKIDARGQATLAFDTPRGAGYDLEYLIEARVTDTSRREVSATNTVRVTRQRFYAYPRPRHQIYRPRDKVTLDLKTLDANDQPVAAEGRLTVTREHWTEVWLAPDGREVTGEELRRTRERAPKSPQSNRRGERPWRLKFRGYRREEVLKQTLRTDARGEAELSFAAEREGFYRAAWVSVGGGEAVRGETTVWVATNTTTDTGFRTSGVAIVADRDTFRPGERAPVLLSTDAPGRFVLFGVEAEDLDSYQLVRMEGTAKLVEVPVDARHVPNLYLSATTVADAQIHADTKQVVVPPVGQFLNVEVKADREQYEPRDEGTLTVTTRDHAGRGVAAEVALGLVDESVFYIQRDYAADPRQFYYGDKRRHLVQTQSTFQQRAYARTTETPGNNERAEGDDDEVTSSEVVTEYATAADAVRPSVAGAGRGAKGEARQYKSVRADGTLGRLATNGAPAATRAAPEPSPATPAGAEPAVVVRTDFRSTVFWQPDVTTDANGQATVKVKYPDSLTGWQATARAATAASQFGTANASTRTRKPLIVRLQAPRFFVVGDEVTVSAVVNNNTDSAQTIAPVLDAEGVSVAGQVVNGRLVEGGARPVEVKANGEARVDWKVKVERAGAARLKVSARGAAHADAMERAFEIHEHGLEKFLSKSGKLRGDSVAVRLDLPRERRADSTSLVLQVTPSTAVTMLDALPYLVHYPYGCTEQTMSRFLPAVITAKTLAGLGVKPEQITGRVFGGVERGHASATHPEGAKDFRQLEEITRQSLTRLYDFQHADGGWGWWKEGDSDRFMTAYVVWGMTLARGAGVEVKPDVLARAVSYLDKSLVEEEASFDRQAWLLHALAVQHAAAKRAEPTEFQAKAFENLWRNRDRLNAYTRALLALSAHHFGYREQARTLVDNLSNGVKVDEAPDTSIVERGAGSSHAGTIATAHWGSDGIFYRWSEGGVEATSFALRALLAIEPQHKLIEPVVNWLIKNRRGAQWSNTRDTAIAVLALNDYLRASGELRADSEYELSVNGQTVAAKKLSAADVLQAPSRFEVPRELLRDGANEITLRRRAGSSPLYFAAEARFFSLEEPVTPAGNELFVRRQYYKLVGRPTLLKGYVYERVPLGDGETVESGERVEAVVTVESKNNYEYLLFEDLKPAGFEAVEVRSGSPVHARELKSGEVGRRFGAAGADGRKGANASEEDYTNRSRRVYQELRDRKVALFLDQMPEGVWEIRYTLRAEAPGRFHALPLTGHAMYVPEIRANGTEVRVNVQDGR